MHSSKIARRLPNLPRVSVSVHGTSSWCEVWTRHALELLHTISTKSVHVPTLLQVYGRYEGSFCSAGCGHSNATHARNLLKYSEQYLLPRLWANGPGSLSLCGPEMRPVLVLQHEGNGPRPEHLSSATCCPRLRFGLTLLSIAA